MSLQYRKVGRCRVCKSPVGDRIDKDLLNSVPFQTIIARFGATFDAAAPLNATCLKNHNKHLREAVEAAAAELRITQRKQEALSEANAPHDPRRQQVFKAAVREKINEQDVMQELIASGLNDLKLLAAETPEQEKDRHLLMARDRVRGSTAKIALGSATVKQMQVEAETERHRFEMGRLMFRMLEVLGRAMQCAPDEFRGLMKAEVKKAINDDDELRTLLREQQSKPALPAPAPVSAGPGEVSAAVDGVSVPATEGDE